MEFINNFISWLDTVIWAPFMVILLLGTHIFLTLRTGFIQRKVFTGIKLSVTKDPSKDGDVSPFQALTTALASTICSASLNSYTQMVFSKGLKTSSLLQEKNRKTVKTQTIIFIYFIVLYLLCKIY